MRTGRLRLKIRRQGPPQTEDGYRMKTGEKTQKSRAQSGKKASDFEKKSVPGKTYQRPAADGKTGAGKESGKTKGRDSGKGRASGKPAAGRDSGKGRASGKPAAGRDSGKGRASEKPVAGRDSGKGRASGKPAAGRDSGKGKMSGKSAGAPSWVKSAAPKKKTDRPEKAVREEKEFRSLLYLLPEKVSAKELSKDLDFIPEKEMEIWNEEGVLEITSGEGAVTFEDIRDSLEREDEKRLSELGIKQVLACDYEAANAALVRKILETFLSRHGGKIGSDTEDFTPFLEMQEI